MSKQVKIRRGTAAQHASFTGVEGEITVDTTADTVRVHDGVTVGGRPLLRADLTNIAGTVGVTRGGTGATTQFTAGSVVFAGASGVYSQDNANLFWDDANNRLGIGTTTPAFRLDVASTAENVARIIKGSSGGIPSITHGELIVESSDANVGIQLLGTATSNQKILFGDADSSSAGQLTYDHTSNYMSMATSGAERMRITSAGNVGIGTTSPSNKLDVVGSINCTNRILLGSGVNNENCVQIGTGRTGNGFAYVDFVGDTTYSDYGFRIIRNNTGANATSILTHRGTGAFIIQTEEAAPIQIYTSNTERMRIDSAGNVGIGTNNPNFKLTVNGSFLNTHTTIAPGNTTSQFVGMSLSNPYTSGDGFSFIDAQGQNNITDSHIIFVHYADYGSAINFATQPAGTNTDRRTVRLTIGPSGLITAPAVYSTAVTPSRVVYTDTAGNLGYNASILAAKINVADLTDTDWLSALHPVTFNYRKLDEDRNYTDEAEADLEYGLIAEEVEGVNTELVFYDETENGLELRGVHYNKLIVPLLAEVQKLRAELNDTKARLAAVEGAIA